MLSVAQSVRPRQLPNSIREMFLGVGAPKTAILLDLLYTLGYKSGHWVTFKECLDVAGDYTAVHIIREGLQHWTIPQKTLAQSRKGRPTIAYKLPFIDSLMNDLVVDKSWVTDVLEREDFRNVKSYKMAMHREMIARAYINNNRQPVVFSRKLMTERLNVSPDTLRRYEKELETYVEPRWINKPIRYPVEIQFLPKKRVHDGRHLLVVSDGRTIGRVPCIAPLAGMYYKKGYELWIVKRGCNAYAPYSPISDQGKQDRFGKWANIVKT